MTSSVTVARLPCTEGGMPVYPATVLRVRILLEGTGLFGGVKVALLLGEQLRHRGHDVTVVSREPTPDWMSTSLRFVQAPGLDAGPPADVVVATYWSTIAPARATGLPVLHLCQGYEGDFSHNVHEHAAIAAAYATPLPAAVVSPHLAEAIAERFGRQAFWVPQPLEPIWHPEEGRTAGVPPRILVVGPFEIDWKGVAIALAAVARLRAAGTRCRLVRLSQWPQGDAERRMVTADEYHCRLKPPAAAALMRGVDLLLAPSRRAEGFGLPLLEAMASGVPAVASDIPAFAYARAAADLVPMDDVEAFAGSAARLLADSERWRRHRQAGLEVAAGFGPERAGAAFDHALRQAIAGAAR